MGNLSRIYVGWVEPRASPTIFRNAGGARPRLDPPYVFYTSFQVEWSGENEANRDPEQSRLAGHYPLDGVILTVSANFVIRSAVN